MAIENALRLRRITRGLTQAQLAKAVNISQQLLSKLERDLVQMTPVRALDFAEVLKCNAAELLPALRMVSQPEAESSQELELLALFRGLDDQQRQIIMATAALFQDQNSEEDRSTRVTAN